MRECCICYETVSNPVFLPCSHFLCESCLVKLEQNKCPFCREFFDLFLARNLQRNSRQKGHLFCREFFDLFLARNLQRNFVQPIFPGDYIYPEESKKIKIKFRKRRKDKIIIAEKNKDEIIIHEKIKKSKSQKRNINSGKENKRKGSWSLRNY